VSSKSIEIPRLLRVAENFSVNHRLSLACTTEQHGETEEYSVVGVHRLKRLDSKRLEPNRLKSSRKLLSTFSNTEESGMRTERGGRERGQRRSLP
jgi:hypothetical protein